MSYKLTPLPSSLFYDYGGLRKSAKSKLVHKLAVYSEVAVVPDVDLVDGNEILYQVVWPKSGTYHNIFHTFLNAVETDHDVIGVFDRYVEGSIKIHKHNRTAGGVVYTSLVLTMDTCLPSARDAVMKSLHNKKDLIRVFTTSNSSDSVDVIGEENSAFKHEEAYCNIISYVQFLIHEQKKSIQVIAEDTDIFVLLVYFSWK